MSRVGAAFEGLVRRMVPAAPDFHGLLVRHCDAVVEAVEAFARYADGGEPADAAAVRAAEHAADLAKAATITALNQAFSTPFDRDLVYLAIVRIDAIANDAKTAVRELEALGLAPDAPTLAMAQALALGVRALRDGFAELGGRTPAGAEERGQVARKAERDVDKVYRSAIARLLDGSPELELAAAGDVVGALRTLLEELRRREVYRHLANAGDRLADAADTLVDIAVASA